MKYIEMCIKTVERRGMMGNCSRKAWKEGLCKQHAKQKTERVKPMTELEQKILRIVDELRGAYWSDFYNILMCDYSVEEIRSALKGLVVEKKLRMKDDDQEHDWEYRRTTGRNNQTNE
jgi:hypothetical protein